MLKAILKLPLIEQLSLFYRFLVCSTPFRIFWYWMDLVVSHSGMQYIKHDDSVKFIQTKKINRWARLIEKEYGNSKFYDP